MLTVKTERAGDIAILKCAGRIVRGQEPALRNAVLAEKLTRIVVLDLTEVDALDAGGLNLLLSLHRWTEGNSIHLKLVNPQPFVLQMLTRTRLDHVFEISSLDHALAVLGGCEQRRAQAAAY